MRMKFSGINRVRNLEKFLEYLHDAIDWRMWGTMKRMPAAFLTLLTLGSTLFLFQNCGKAGFDSSEFSDEQSSLSLDPKFNGLSFPYDISVNQIAHMTCPMNGQNGQSNSSPYFSWRVGAFDNGSEVPTVSMGIRSAGLQLSESFKVDWAKIAPTYPPAAQKTKLEQALKTLPSVADARITLGFRNASTPKVTPMNTPNGAASPSNYFLPSMSDDKFVMRYSENMSGVFHTFPEVVSVDQRFLDGRLVIPSQLGAYDASLRAYYDASYLVVGFSNPETGVMMGPSDERYLYGKGFRVRFGVTNPRIGAGYYPASDSLSSVEEYDMSSGSRVSGVNWDCSYKFKIVRNRDRYNPIYKQNNFTLYNGTSCPTTAQTGDFCVLNSSPQFGLPPSAFGGQCPSNRTLVQNTTRCPEQYYAACPQEPYTGNLNDVQPILREDGLYHPNYPERPAILHMMRRFFPSDKWDINVSRRCLVPKTDDTTCYSSSNVVYDETFFTGVAANADAHLYEGCGGDGYYPCAAYVTMCVRK